ncbi:hypothetical protein T484DRAFT_1857355 [Baffinella frigidus]|nr:hypothetical protein T484DRAFT_1857355 [Cryptophyta sp. CCMP2293]
MADLAAYARSDSSATPLFPSLESCETPPPLPGRVPPESAPWSDCAVARDASPTRLGSSTDTDSEVYWRRLDVARDASPTRLGSSTDNHSEVYWRRLDVASELHPFLGIRSSDISDGDVTHETAHWDGVDHHIERHTFTPPPMSADIDIGPRHVLSLAPPKDQPRWRMEYLRRKDEQRLKDERLVRRRRSSISSSSAVDISSSSAADMTPRRCSSSSSTASTVAPVDGVKPARRRRASISEICTAMPPRRTSSSSSIKRASSSSTSSSGGMHVIREASLETRGAPLFLTTYYHAVKARFPNLALAASSSTPPVCAVSGISRASSSPFSLSSSPSSPPCVPLSRTLAALHSPQRTVRTYNTTPAPYTSLPPGFAPRRTCSS